METPSSIRRVTRSQTLTASNSIPLSRKKEDSEKVLSTSRKGTSDRSALVDITNDSPIIGLAMGGLNTPSCVAKNSGRVKQTPGTGEALLRGQVKTLLQKIEEDADLPKISFDRPPFLRFQGLVSSPAALLAPTPSNTPFMSNGNADTNLNGLPSVPVAIEQDPMITQATKGLQQVALESHESLITRALLFDSPGKSEVSDSSASVWSVLVNASSEGDEEIGGLEDSEEVIGEVDDYDEEVEDEDRGLIDELCEGLKKVCVQEKGRTAEFKGRHTRFIYDSDGEIEGEEEVRDGSAVSPSILRLKGMPMPEGKHLRFPEEEV